MKVFLGGTCNDSTWRNKLISKLKIDYFNPVVDDWTPKCQQEEIKQREICDICLYTITKIKSIYSIAEVIDDSNKRPKKTILCVSDECEEFKFSNVQKKHLKAVGDMVIRNGGTVFYDLDSLAKYLNKCVSPH